MSTNQSNPEVPDSLLESLVYGQPDMKALAKAHNLTLLALARLIQRPDVAEKLEALRELKELERQQWQDEVEREATEALRALMHDAEDAKERRRAATAILRAFNPIQYRRSDRASGGRAGRSQSRAHACDDAPRPTSQSAAPQTSSAAPPLIPSAPAPLDEANPIICQAIPALRDPGRHAEVFGGLYKRLNPIARTCWPSRDEFDAAMFETLRPILETERIEPSPPQHPALIRPGEDATRDFTVTSVAGERFNLSVTFFYEGNPELDWLIQDINLSPLDTT